MKKPEWKLLIPALLIPLAVGMLSALFSMGGMEAFGSINQPPLTPPAWLFPIAWGILYLLMGYASYLVLISKEPNGRALLLYGIQLIFNFFWSIWFFSFEAYLFAFLWLLVLWGLILATTVSFYRIDKKAGYLLLPYLLWVTFAAYLNAGVFILNP